VRIFRKHYISGTGSGVVSADGVSATGNGNTLAVVNVNSAAAGAVLTLYDGVDNTGSVVAVIDCSALSSKVYLCHFKTAIYYVLAGGNADITISYE
jgi:hypothetical protein